MKKLRILITLLLFSTFCFAENKQDDRKESDNSKEFTESSVGLKENDLTALDKWNEDFYTSLLDNKSIELQAIAINNLDKDLSTKLETLLSSNRLNVKTYFILADTCEFNDRYKTLCSDHNFFKKFKNIDPNNIMSLTHDLEIALDNKDDKETNQIIEHMSTQNKALVYYGNSMDKIKQAMVNYNEIQAIPINYSLLSQITSLQNILDDHELLKTFNENKVEITINIEVFTAIFLGLPSYRAIIKSCKNLELFNECNLISDIFINQSDILITKHIGYAIKRITNNLKRDFENFEQANINVIKLQKYTECIQNLDDEIFYFHMYLQPIHMDTFIENIDKFGELKTYQKAAKSLHTYLVDRGIESTYSAKDCNKIQNLTNQEFYSSYGEDNAFVSRMEEYDEPLE